MALTTGMLVRIVGTRDVGTLMQIRESSRTCVIKLNDGVLKKNVPVDEVEEARPSPKKQGDLKPIALLTNDATTLPAHDESRPRRSSAIAVGDKVKARYKRGTKLYAGKIIKAHSDGTFDVRYDDGDVETRVDPAYIEVPEQAKRSDDADDDRTPRSPSKSKQRPPTIEVGDKVKARYKRGTKLYAGKIIKAHSDGTFDVRYDDGDVETRVDPAYIEVPEQAKRSDDADDDRTPRSPSKSKQRPPTIEVGDKVKARYKRGTKLYAGKIIKAHSDGTFDVRYDDGDVETRVDPAYIEVPEQAKRSDDADDDRTPRSPSKSKQRPPTIEVGDKVKARYKRGTKLYAGKIIKAHSDGTFDVRYDDGDVETRVDPAYIEVPEQAKRSDDADDDRTPRSPSKSKQRPPTIEVGDKVKARYKRGTKLYAGKIIKAHSDGTFDIRYDDGDVETRVDPAYIEVPEQAKRSDDADDDRTPRSPSKSKQRPPTIEVGDKVKARYKRGTKLYAGKIIKAHSDGTFDVRYDDGDVETRVDPAYIEVPEQAKRSDDADDDRTPRSPSKSKQRPPTIEVGDKVKARYKRGTKLYAGKIIKAHSDGTFDVRYDDGDVETRVDPAYIEVPEQAKRSDDADDDRTPRSPSKSKQRPPTIEVGDKVKARYKRGTKLYAGKIIKAHSDGTFDVRYDDGDVETRVDPAYIEVPEQAKRSDDADDDRTPRSPSKSKQRPPTIEVGDKVKARYKRGTKLYAGKIIKAHSDGTFDVRYDDGDVETRVDPAYIEVPEQAKRSDDADDDRTPRSPSKSKQRPPTIEVGDKVKARYKRGTKLYAGKIIKAHSDGTFDVRYDDGDVETRVDPAYIEVPEQAKRSDDADDDRTPRSPSKSKQRPPTIEVGDKVKARYKRGTKLYAGKIIKAHSDGTFDVRYDDGDVETRVDPAYIEVPEQAKRSDDADDDRTPRSPSKSKQRPPTIEVGDKVKARYKRGTKLYAGKIIKAHSDGTFDVRYDDGDVETRVDPAYIEVPEQAKRSDDADDDRTPRSPSKSKQRPPTIEVGDKVKARYKRGTKLYAGKIIKAHSDGTFDVRYDDGDVETRVDPAYIEVPEQAKRSDDADDDRTPRSPSKSKQRPPTIEVGDKVKARYKRGTKLYAGKIIKAHSDGTFDVRYDDGDVETRVDPAYIEVPEQAKRSDDADDDRTPRSPSKSKQRPPTIEVGDKVKARYKRGTKLYAGKIIKAHSDGTFDVRYDDGDVETRVDPAYIEVPEQAKRSDDADDDRTPRSPSKSKQRPPTIEVGDKVKARYKRGTKLYAGKIIKAHSDGTFDVRYDDGDVETRVDPAYIEVPEQAKRSDDADDDRTPRSPSKSKQRPPTIEVGDKVKARYKRGTKLYAGKIIKAHSDGTFDVRYDDGDVETRVDPAYIEVPEQAKRSDDADDDRTPRSPSKSKQRPPTIEVGDKVKARYKRGTKLYAGKIIKAHSDGTFDVRYDDGDVETRVDPAYIEVPEQAKRSDDADDDRTPRSPSKSKQRPPTIEVGDKVKARYKRGTKLYAGKIIKAHSDGTFDIRYDDGDVETRVDPAYIEVPEQAKRSDDADDDRTPRSPSKSKQRPPTIEVGDKVKARYKRGTKLYAGKIIKAHSDGTFDVRYDDGDVETRVDPAYIEVPEQAKRSDDADDDRTPRSPSKSKQRPPTIEVGDKVKARYKRGTKLYAGKIIKAHSDGTFDVRYDDGDVETRVDPAYIEVPEQAKRSDDADDDRTPRSPSKSKQRPPTIEVGDKVKARYKRGTKLYAGKIIKAHSDGTFDVRYDDGDVETRVDPAYIEVPEQAKRSDDADDDRTPRSPSKSKQRPPTIEVGDKVKARYKRGTKLYAGKIIKAHSDGTFDVRYDDGDVETRVDPAYIEVPEQAKRSDDADDDRTPRSPSKSKQRPPTIEVGDKVKARYKRGTKLYAGKIIKAHSDGTFDVRYDDGDVETRVDPAYIEVPEQAKRSDDADDDRTPRSPSKSKQRPPTIEVGDKVKARYKRGTKLYAGKIIKAHSDGTFDVRYDDGDVETRVDPAYIEVPEQAKRSDDADDDRTPRSPSKSKQRPPTIEVGDKVKARYKRGTKLYAGKIIKAHSDGTFDVRYDDGDVETRVDPAYIEVPEQAKRIDDDISDEAKDVAREQDTPRPVREVVATVDRAEAKDGHNGWLQKVVDPCQVELKPVSFLAACWFANGDSCCRSHEDLVRRLCVGRTSQQADWITRFRDAFEALTDAGEDELVIRSSQLDKFAARCADDPSVLRGAISTIRKRTAFVSLVEVFASCGFVIDELACVPTVTNAIEKMRLRLDPVDVRRIITLVRNMCLKVLRFPNNPDYWRIRSDSSAFKHKIGRFDGATSLLEAVGFLEYDRAHFELRGARTSEGRRVTSLAKHVLDQLREKCAELDSDLALLDGVENVAAILQRISVERHKDAPLTVLECKEVLTHLLICIENVLKNPTDSKCWRIRESNKTFQRHIGYLPFSVDLMEAIGFECVPTASDGNIFVLRGTGASNARPAEDQAFATLTNFAFTRVSERMEWFLWRRREEIESLLQDDMHYLIEIMSPFLSTAPEHSLPSQSLPRPSLPSTVVKMFPYGRNAAEIFNKNRPQRTQIAIMKKTFHTLDRNNRGFLSAGDLVVSHEFPATTQSRWIAFEAFDLNQDDRVDLDDFIGSLGAVLDHALDTSTVVEIIPWVRMTLCEQLAVLVGRLRLASSAKEAFLMLDALLSSLHRIIDEPNNTALWRISTKSALANKAARFVAFRDLLTLLGFAEEASNEQTPAASGVEQTEDSVFLCLQTKKTRFRTKSSQSTGGGKVTQQMDPQLLSRLQLATAVLGCHTRALVLPSISDVGAVSRALGMMKPIPDWIKLVELAIACIENVIQHPEEERYRHLKTATPTFTSTVANVLGGVQLLLSIGFRETERGTLHLPDDVSSETLSARRLELEVGLHVLRITERLGRQDFVQPDLSSQHAETGDPKSPRAQQAAEYYRRKALAAELAKDEAVKRSVHLEKKLELATKRQSRRGDGVEVKRAMVRSPRATTATSRSTQLRFGDTDEDIEAELLAAFSPRRDLTRSAPTLGGSTRGRSARGGSHSGHSRGGATSARGNTGRTVVSRRPASVVASTSISAAVAEAHLGADAKCGQDAVLVRSAPWLRKGVLLSFGSSDRRDLIEERLISDIEETVHAHLARVRLHAPLCFSHAARQLVSAIVNPAQKICARLSTTAIEQFIRADLLPTLINRSVEAARSSGQRMLQTTSHRPRNRSSTVSSLQVLRSFDVVGTGITTVSPQLIIVSVHPTHEANNFTLSVCVDTISTAKVESVWESLILEYGHSSSTVPWSIVQECARKSPILSVTLHTLGLPKVPHIKANATHQSYQSWLQIGEDGVFGAICIPESVDESTAKTLLRPNMRALLKKGGEQGDDPFRRVSVHDMTQRTMTDLDAIASNPEEIRDFAGVRSMLSELQEAFKRVRTPAFHPRKGATVSWPEVSYFLSQRRALNTPEVLPTAATVLHQSSSSSTRPKAQVVDVVVADVRKWILLLLDDGFVEIWQADALGRHQQRSRSRVLWLNTSIHKCFVESYESTLRTKAMSMMQRPESSVTSALQSFLSRQADFNTKPRSPRSQVMALTCHDSILVVNASVLSLQASTSEQQTANSFFMYSVTDDGRIRALRSTTLEEKTIELRDLSPQRTSANIRRSRGQTAVSKGLVNGFTVSNDSRLVAYTLFPRNASATGAIWLAELGTGRVLGGIDEFVSPIESEALLYTSIWTTRDDTETRDVIAVSSLRSRYVAVWQCYEGHLSRLVTCRQAPQESNAQESSTITALVATADALIASFSDFNLAIWRWTDVVTGNASPLVPCFVVSTENASVSALFPIRFDVAATVRRPTFTPAFKPQEEEFSSTSSSQTSVLRIVLYLLVDGRVVEISVDSFKPEHLDIGNQTLMDEQWLVIENDRLETKQSALKDILLQPERVVRIAFLTCRYAQDGIFIDSSMRSLLDEIVSRRILQRSKPDIDRFASERRDTVELKFECFYRQDHGDSALHELTLNRATRSSYRATESPAALVLGALCSATRASGNSRRLQVWAIHTVECTASSVKDEASAGIRWDSVFLRNGWIIEAQRLRARLHSQSQDRWAATLKGQLKEITHEIRQLLAPQLHSAFVDSDRQPQLANALLRHVRRYAWVIAQRVRCHGDPFERYLRELVGHTTQDIESRTSWEVAVLLKRLRDERRRNAVWQPWLRRLCNALTSDGRGSNEINANKVTFHEIELLVRRWRSAFLGIESVSALVVELGLIPLRPSDSDTDVALAIARQQFSAFALSRRQDNQLSDSNGDTDAEYHAAWTFISPQVVVSFLLQQGNLAGRMEQSLDLVRARVEEDRLQSHRDAHERDADDEKERGHERRYVLALRRQEWRHQLEQLLSRQVRVACLSTSKTADAMWLTRTRSALRQLLLTRLPIADTGPEAVTVRPPVVARLVGSRWIVDAVDRNDASGATCSLVLRIESADPSEVALWSTEHGFLRRMQHFSARRYFLPLVTSDARDAAIRGSDTIRLTSHLKNNDAPLLALVCESLTEWRTLSERLSLLRRLPTAPQAQSHWSALLLSWCQQVLESLIAIEICVDQSDRRLYKLQRLSLDDVMVDPQCEQVCLTALDMTLEDANADSESQRCAVLEWHTSLYAQFVLELLTQFKTDLYDSSPVTNDSSARHHRRLVLRVIERLTDERLVRSLRACLTPEEISDQQDAAVDASTLTLMKVALMVCLPPVTRPTLSTVWGLVFRATSTSTEASAAAQARAFALLTSLQEALETDVLRPFSIVTRAFTQQTTASALGSLLELYCAALSRVVALIQRLLSGGEEEIADVVLQTLCDRRVWAHVAAITLSFFVRFVANGQRDGAQHVINATIEAIRSVLGAVDAAANATSAPTIWLHQQQTTARLVESVVAAFISVATGEMPEQTDVARIVTSTAQQSVLWRLCEPAMQDLVTRDSSMRRLWDAQHRRLRDLIAIREGTELQLWWNDRDYEDPPRRDATVVPVFNARCLRYLHELHASLELRFSIAGGRAIPARYRLASLQGCFAPSRLQRRRSDALAISDAINARVWCDLQMQRTLRELLEDTDERIVHAAISVLDAYTRVLRCDFASQLLHTEALELAYRLCSPELLITLGRLLTRVVRQLRLLGESGTGASRSSSYGAALTAQMTYTSASARSKSPIAVLCVALSYLVNTLHGAQRATQHWVSSGILSVLMGFARSNVLSFLRVVDANLLVDITGSSASFMSRGNSRRTGRDSCMQQQKTEWFVFTVEDAQSARRRTSAASTHESPFRVLLRELMTHEQAPSSLSLLQHIRESKRNVQLLLEVAPHEAFTAQLLLNGDLGLLCHVAAVMTDMDECEGTLCEKAQSLHYARAAVGQWLSSRRCVGSRDSLPSHLLRVCRLAWNWMDRAIESGAGPRSWSIVMAALHLLYAVATSAKLTSTEVCALCQLHSPSGDSIASQASVFQSVMSLVTRSDSDTQSQGTLTFKPGATAVECLCALLHPAKPHGRAIMLSLVGIQSFVDVLRCSSVSSSDKFKLWCAMLEICDQETAIATVNSGFLEVITTACSQPPTKANKQDRIEGLLYLEALHYAFELLDKTTGADALRLELIKCVIHCRAVRSLWQTATSSTADVPFARRVLQIVCSFCVNHTTGETDAAVLADLEAAGVMAQVVEWHQARGNERLVAEATSVRKRIVEFWFTWPKHSLNKRDRGIPENPKQSVMTVTQATMPSVMQKPVDRSLIAFDLVEPPRHRSEKHVQQLASQLEQRVRVASTQEQQQSKKMMPLDEVLHCVGEHIATLEAVFARYASTGEASTSGVMPWKRLVFALRDCGIAIESGAVATSEREALPFSQFLLQYARHSGLETAWTRRNRERAWRWVLLPNSEWVTISPTQLETLHRKLSRQKIERVISTSNALRALKSLFLGRLAPADLERIIRSGFRDPMAVDPSDGMDTVTFPDVCRAFLLVQREVDRHGPSQRITLPEPQVDAPRETRSPTRSSKRRQDAATNADSIVHALVSVDVESAQALAAVDAMKEREAAPRRMKKTISSQRLESKRTAGSSVSSGSASIQDTRSVNSDSDSGNDRARRARPRTRRTSRESKEESQSSAEESGSESRKPKRRPTKVDAKAVKEDKRLVERERSNPTLRLKRSTAAAEPKPMLKRDSRVRDHDMEALQRVFRQYDVDGDGAISFIDLRRALDKRGTCRLSNVELQRWIAEKDSRGAGAVNFDDFVRAFGTTSRPSTTAQSQHPMLHQAGHVERFGRNVDFYS